MHTKTDQPTVSADAAPPAATLLRMMTGYWPAQAIYVAAKLGIADLLAQGPASAESLASATGSDADAMYRLLRALSGLGVFTEISPDKFGLSPMAELLQTGTAASMRALA